MTEEQKQKMAGPKIMPGAEEELEYFIRIPEFRERFQRGNAVVLSRRDQEADGRGSTGKLFSQTLSTPTTIPRCIVMFDDTFTAQSSAKYWLPVTTCSVFYQLGTGVCGFGNICHGGIQTTLLDDVMGVLGVLNARLQDGLIPSNELGAYLPTRNRGMLDLTKSLFATQGIEVQFLRPLRTPQVIEVVVHLEEVDADGGSYTVRGVIKDMSGKQYAIARTKWIVYAGHRSRL
jgi:acyl-coenzyme A thioesterase PaaI-like protein